MIVSVTNAQHQTPVDMTAMTRLARRAIRRLRIRTRGTLAITFIDDRRMRALNKRFKRHDWVTDVLSFRYDGSPTTCLRPPKAGRPARRRPHSIWMQPPAARQVVGEILIAPRQAKAYARHQGVAYRQELSRYVVHGLLHWLGHDDRTNIQQRTMRIREDRLLAQCRRKLPITKSQSPKNHR